MALVFWQLAPRRLSGQFRQPHHGRRSSFSEHQSRQGNDFLRLALPDEIATALSYVHSLSIRPFATTSKYNGL